MSFLDFLFGGARKKKRKASKHAKKAAKKVGSKGLKHFVIFDGDTDTKLANVSAKSEVQAFKFWANSHPKEAETARIISKRRWDKET